MFDAVVDVCVFPYTFIFCAVMNTSIPKRMFHYYSPKLSPELLTLSHAKSVHEQAQVMITLSRSLLGQQHVKMLPIKVWKSTSRIC